MQAEERWVRLRQFAARSRPSGESLELRRGYELAMREILAEMGRLERPASSTCTWLTPRQVQVLDLVAAGYTAREVAGELCMSYNTARTHLENIRKRLGVRSQAAAVAKGDRNGMGQVQLQHERRPLRPGGVAESARQ